MDTGRIDELVRTRIETVEELEAVVGVPTPAILEKHTTFTTPLMREYIEQARFFVLATSDADGNCDCSPRGDLISKVLFPDDKTLVLPDRPGNRRGWPGVLRLDRRRRPCRHQHDEHLLETAVVDRGPEPDVLVEPLPRFD